MQNKMKQALEMKSGAIQTCGNSVLKGMYMKRKLILLIFLRNNGRNIFQYQLHNDDILPSVIFKSNLFLGANNSIAQFLVIFNTRNVVRKNFSNQMMIAKIFATIN